MAAQCCQETPHRQAHRKCPRLCSYPSTLSNSRAPRHGGLTTNLNEILQDQWVRGTECR